MSEVSTRIPSAIAGVLCLFLIYEIGKIILNQKVAWLAAAISSMHLWV
ncbi:MULTISPECIES: glycosyltransferase family 39 protein [Nostocaceae]